MPGFSFVWCLSERGRFMKTIRSHESFVLLLRIFEIRSERPTTLRLFYRQEIPRSPLLNNTRNTVCPILKSEGETSMPSWLGVYSYYCRSSGLIPITYGCYDIDKNTLKKEIVPI